MDHENRRQGQCLLSSHPLIAIVSESTAAHMAGLLEVLVEDRGIELVWDAIRLLTIRTQGNILRALAVVDHI